MLFKNRLSILSLILYLTCTSLFAAQLPGKTAKSPTPAFAASAMSLAAPTSSESGANKRKADATPSASAAESDSLPEHRDKRLKTDNKRCVSFKFLPRQFSPKPLSDDTKKTDICSPVDELLIDTEVFKTHDPKIQQLLALTRQTHPNGLKIIPSYLYEVVHTQVGCIQGEHTTPQFKRGLQWAEKNLLPRVGCFTVEDIKELHRQLTQGTQDEEDFDKDSKSGEFRSNWVWIVVPLPPIINPYKSVYIYVDQLLYGAIREGKELQDAITKSMEKFVLQLNSKIQANAHPLATAAFAHQQLGRIHPFGDGNGRTARCLMNIILMAGGYLPVILVGDTNACYGEACCLVHKYKKPLAFLEFLCRAHGRAVAQEQNKKMNTMILARAQLKNKRKNPTSRSARARLAHTVTSQPATKENGHSKCTIL